MNSVDFYTEVVGDVTPVSTNRSGRVSDSASPRKRGRVSDSEEVIVPFSYTDAVVLSRKHNVDMQLADGTMWSNYSWINDGHEVRLDMSVGGMDTEAREDVFRGSRSKYFKMDEALAETAAEYLLVQVIDDESDFYKEWMWKNPSKDLFESVAKVVAEVRGSESSAEDAAVALDQALPTSDSGYVQDSAEVAKIVGEHVGKPVQKARVKDDNAVSTYADLVSTLEAEQVSYSLEDYTIESESLKLDAHDIAANAGAIRLYGIANGADSYRHDYFDDLYKSGSVSEFYEKAPLDVIEVYISGPNRLKLDYVLRNPTKEQITLVVDAVVYCHEEHLSPDQAVSYFKRNLKATFKQLTDSAKCTRHDKKVSDASEEVVYDTLAEEFNKNGIEYSMEDYVLWSEQIELDNHNQGDEAQLIVYGLTDGVFEEEKLDAMDARYDEIGVDAFYAETPLWRLGVQLFATMDIAPQTAPIEYVVDKPTKNQVQEVLDAVIFCHEEHLGYDEAKAHLDEVFGPMKNAAHVDMAADGRVSDDSNLDWSSKEDGRFEAHISDGSIITKISVEKNSDGSWYVSVGSVNGGMSSDIRSAITDKKFSSDADAKKYAERVVSILNDAGSAVLKLEA